MYMISKYKSYLLKKKNNDYDRTNRLYTIGINTYKYNNVYAAVKMAKF